MRFDNISEELFYDFLNDFELTSMINGIESQVKINTFGKNRRIDFVITLTNGEKMFIEFDGSIHNRKDVAKEDYAKDVDLSQIGINLIRVNYREFYRNKECLANRLEGLIDIMTGQ